MVTTEAGLTAVSSGAGGPTEMLERYTEDDTGKLIKAADHEETMDKTDTEDSKT